MSARLDEVMARALAGDPNEIARGFKGGEVLEGNLASVARGSARNRRTRRRHTDPVPGRSPVTLAEMHSGQAHAECAALDRHLGDVLPATNIPASYLFVGALPRTRSMKVNLRATNALLWERTGEPAISHRGRTS